jgi:hypothetical protein
VPAAGWKNASMLHNKHSQIIYFAYFHAAMQYGIILWGDSVASKRIFQQQKRIIKFMTGSTSRILCETLFKKLEILTLTS